MTESPEIVAHADLSPASPKPIHHTSTSPALIPSLQDTADTLDVAYLDSLVPPTFPFITMPSENPPTSNPEDAADDYIEVDAEMSDVLSEMDDESFDAYGETEADGDQKEAGDTVGADTSAHAQNMDGDESSDSNNAPATETGNKEVETSTTQPDGAEEDVSETSSISIINDSPPTSEPEVLTEGESLAIHPSIADAQPSNDLTQPNEQPSPETEQQQPSSTTAEVPSDSSAHEATTAPASNPPPAAAPAPESTSAPVPEQQDNQADDGTIDIQKLVDDITARAAEASSEATSTQPKPNPSASLSSSMAPAVNTTSTPSLTIPPSSSLPAKPASVQPLGQRPEDFHPFAAARGYNSSHAPPPLSGQGTNSGHTTGGAYMTGAPGASSLPPHPRPSGFNGSQTSQPGDQASYGHGALHGAHLEQAWEAFQADEKRYLTEAKWEKFPDGSRVFVGNLSSERVPKREVFDLFHRFGRLAQISLKSAYGFVQYHSAEDAQRAMVSAEGAELGGRKIHLEISKTQKRRDPNDHSPDRRGVRGSDRGGRGGGVDRYDARDRGDPRGRDDYRPGRSPSPRRGDGYGRDRGYNHGPRGRSRSPNRYGRYEQDSYRRRSPSPRRRGPPQPEPELDVPRRYGDQVPDVQIIVLGEVDRNFVAWLPQVFQSRGLKPDVMFVNPYLPRDSLLHKHVLEGVHGVVELDVTAQHKGKIPLRVFDRSAGINNVRFDQYQDLDPVVAAEVILRAKQTQQQAQPAHVAPQPAYPPNPYPPQQHMYPPQQAAAPVGYPGYGQMPAAAPQPQAVPPQSHGLSAQDIAGLAGKVDNATLQALLASLGPGAGGAPQQPPADINAILASLGQAPGGGAPAPTATPSYGYGGGAYAPPAAGQPGQPAQGSADAVQNIMATLAKYR